MVSKEAEARYLPDGWNSTRQTRPLWPCSVCSGVSLLRDHRWTSSAPPWPPEPEARFSVSGVGVEAGGSQAMPPTMPVWPRRVVLVSRLGTDSSLMPPDQLPAAMVSPSGEKRVMLTGRSPAIWEPKSSKPASLSFDGFAVFDVCAEGNGAVFALARDTLTSAREGVFG